MKNRKSLNYLIVFLLSLLFIFFILIDIGFSIEEEASIQVVVSKYINNKKIFIMIAMIISTIFSFVSILETYRSLGTYNTLSNSNKVKRIRLFLMSVPAFIFSLISTIIIGFFF